MGELRDPVARGPASEDCRLPDARRSVRAADLEGIEEIFSKAGIKTVYRETYTIDNPNYDGIASAIKSRNPDVVVHGATFEDGVGMVRALRKSGFTPKMLYQTTAPSLGDQYSKAIGKPTTEGIFYAVSHSKEATTPGNEEFVAKYQEMFGGTEVPEDAADAYATAQVLQAAVKAVGTIDRERQLELADWLRENEVDTILGPLTWDDLGPAGGRVPRRPVAERRSGDRAARGGGHLGQDHPGVAAGRRRVEGSLPQGR